MNATAQGAPDRNAAHPVRSNRDRAVEQKASMAKEKAAAAKQRIGHSRGGVERPAAGGGQRPSAGTAPAQR